MDILEFKHFYLVGIKGVGMAVLAQLLDSAGKEVAGSDVEEDFITQEMLEEIGVAIDVGFEPELPATTDCVIYTAAHQGPNNPQVVAAQQRGLQVFSHAEALGLLFNQKKGIAVCGVGGKTTTSAMLAWIFAKTGREIAYAVGVPEIIGLDQAGKWSKKSQYFIAEADEYVTDPQAAKNGQKITPRFSFLQPHIVIAKKILWDHPDVYRDYNHTLAVFNQFFSQINSNGTLILPVSERQKVAPTISQDIWDYGPDQATFIIEFDEKKSIGGKTVGYLTEPVTHQKHQIELSIPGAYNFDNAVAAIIGAYAAEIPITESVAALASFQSTKRRFEVIGEKNGVKFYDDYAHHPMEVASVIAALKQWFPQQKKVVVFQPHTYSRTKELFADFVAALSQADELILSEIFASARETADPSISVATLAQAIRANNPDLRVHEASDLPDAAKVMKSVLSPGDVCLTLGAGNIYKVHKMI